MLLVGQSLKSKNGTVIKIITIVENNVTVIFSKSQTQSSFSLLLLLEMLNTGEYVKL